MENCCNSAGDTSEAILAFDTLYTTNHMKILKLLFPYLEAEYQNKLAVYIKWQEFIFTLQFINRSPSPSPFYHKSFKGNLDFTAVYPTLCTFCNKEEREFLSKISGIMNMKNIMNQVQEYLPLIQGILSSGEANDNFSPIDMMKNFLSEEQMTMFSMFMEGNENSSTT